MKHLERLFRALVACLVAYLTVTFIKYEPSIALWTENTRGCTMIFAMSLLGLHSIRDMEL